MNKKSKKRMKLVNLSNGTVINDDIILAKNLKNKIIGLLDKKSPAALYFKTRWGIHTFGMKFSIDCVILDRGWKVSAVKENLLPYKLFFWNPKYFRVIELPTGSIRESGISLNDTLSIE